MIIEAIQALVEGQTLTIDQAADAMSDIMEDRATPAQFGAFVTALRMKGETADEVAGMARTMREKVLRVPTDLPVVDTCGTGGDELRTFNISTATAFVAAACGVPVAKHGNRGVSSSSGSADVLEALGVRTSLSPAQVGRCIDELGIGFCFAPVFHGAMKHAAPVRKALRFRTLFNLLGPLTNPANAEFQLLGASRIATAEKLAQASAQLGRRRVLVVCGNDQLDEVSLWETTTVFEVGDATVRRQTWSARTFGLSECSVDQLQVASPTDSAARIRAVFAGERSAARDMIVANAAAALIAANAENDPLSAAGRAAAALESGDTDKLLRRFAELTQTLSN